MTVPGDLDLKFLSIDKEVQSFYYEFSGRDDEEEAEGRKMAEQGAQNLESGRAREPRGPSVFGFHGGLFLPLRCSEYDGLVRPAVVRSN